MHNPCYTDSFRLYLFFALAFSKFYLPFSTDHYLDMHAFLGMLKSCHWLFQSHLKLNLWCPTLILIFLQTCCTHLTHYTKWYRHPIQLFRQETEESCLDYFLPYPYLCFNNQSNIKSCQLCLQNVILVAPLLTVTSIDNNLIVTTLSSLSLLHQPHCYSCHC